MHSGVPGGHGPYLEKGEVPSLRLLRPKAFLFRVYLPKQRVARDRVGNARAAQSRSAHS